MFKSRLVVGNQQHPLELFLLIKYVTFEYQNSGVLCETTTPYLVSERHRSRKEQFCHLNLDCTFYYYYTFTIYFFYTLLYDTFTIFYYTLIIL